MRVGANPCTNLDTCPKRRAHTREVHGKTQAEESHLQTKGEASQETNPADNSILDLWPQALWESKFLLLKPPRLWYFVLKALGD